MNGEDLQLYARQILMPSIGIEAQQQLLDSTVLIVGAGGLGNTVAQYLLGSGVGQLLIVDHDVIEYSNLPRQILFNETDVGLPKSETLCRRLNQRLAQSQPRKCCMGFYEVYSDTLMQRLLNEYSIDVLIDAGDNLPLSYQLDAAATQYSLPLVHASVSRFEGHCYTRLPAANFPTLEKLFPQPAQQETCSQSGVLTVAVGLIGSCQAAMTIRVLLAAQLGETTPELLLFDGLTMRFMPLSVANHPETATFKSVK